MPDNDEPAVPVTRRTALQTLGGVTATVSLAGCSAIVGEETVGQDGAGEIPSEPLQMAVPTFLSGAAAVLGQPTADAAELIVDRINENGGILGERGIELNVVDEDEGEPSSTQRQLTEQANSDVIIGWASSANAQTVAPLAEDMQQPTIFYDTGTPALFEESVTDPKWTFRTGASISIESVGLAQMIAQGALDGDVERVAHCHPDYAFGRTSADLFNAAISRLAPDVEVVEERFPALGTSDFTSHITALENADPDLVMTVLWGGDMVNFGIQSAEHGLWDDTQLAACAGTSAFSEIDEGDWPEGVWVGARGPHFSLTADGIYNEQNPYQEQFVNAYRDEFGRPPYTYSIWHMWTAIHMYVNAVEKAANILGEYPTDEQIVESMRYSGIYSPSGYTSLSSRNGHQAHEPWVMGQLTWENPDGPAVTNVQTIESQSVNPPSETNHFDWVDSL